MTGSSPNLASGQHTISLNGDTANLVHPAGCQDPAACPFVTAAAALTPVMLATGGTWTCGLHDGALILHYRIDFPT